MTEEMLDQIRERVSPQGGWEFMRQMMAAVKQAHAEGDLAPINRVIESWYRTMLFVGRPHFFERWEQAGENEVPLSLADIRKRRAPRAGDKNGPIIGESAGQSGSDSRTAEGP